MSKIVVVGSNGYIGQHITNKLIQSGHHELFLFDVQPSSHVFPDKYKQLNLSNTLGSDVKETLGDADFVFFFAGLTGTTKSIDNYADFIQVNEIGLLNVLACIKDLEKKPKIIFPSTRLVYKGVTDKLLKEDDEKEYKTIYAINKFACENYLEIYKNLYGINYTIFRICVPYGNLLAHKMSFGTLSHFINKAQAGDDIVLFGDGQLKRTFTHVDDLTELMTLGGLSEKTNNQIFNIGSNDHLSLYEIANSIASLYKVNIQFADFPAKDLAIESGDTMFDGSKLCSLLNYSYKYLFKNWVKIV